MSTGPLSKALAPVLAALALATNAWALPTYEIVPLGLLDSEHTASDGYQFSQLGLSTESGYVAGRSYRFVGGKIGDSAWLYDPAVGTSTRLGFFDASHTRSEDGYQSSRAGVLTESGYVTGTSERFNGSSSGGLSAWLYDASTATTTRLGYTDAAHTRSDGLQHSEANWLRPSGYAAGRSVRYSGMESFGESAWRYDPSSATTTRLGFFDAGYVRSDGYQYTELGTLMNSGDAAGYSVRYGGAAYLGEAAWLYDSSSATTLRLGFFDAEYTRNDGVQFSAAHFITEAGHVAGISSRYDGGTTYLGEAVWLRNAAGVTSRIGFYDVAHTLSNGYQNSGVDALVESGYATGYSDRYGGATFLGRSAWLSDVGGATVRIGLFDGDHTRNDGYQFSSGSSLTSSGYATGYSERFGGAAPLGRSAWVYDAPGGATTRLGLFDAPHTRSDGYQFSSPGQLRESGYVVGSSERFGGATSLGQSAWFHDTVGGTTTRIGLFDAAHTGSGGYQNNAATWLTESGYVAGISRPGLAQSAWLYDASRDSTTRLGLFDAQHTRSDGYQYSSVDRPTESGYVAGSSDRFHGATALGRTAWVYHAPTDTSYSITLSTRSNGYASSSVSFLSADGLALGSYNLYDVDDSDLGLRAFAWTVQDGAVDLGGLVAGGLTAEGWGFLASAIRENGLQQIIGSGRLATGGDLVYLLVAVPEPGAGYLGLLALCALARRARRGPR